MSQFVARATAVFAILMGGLVAYPTLASACMGVPPAFQRADLVADATVLNVDDREGGPPWVTFRIDVVYAGPAERTVSMLAVGYVQGERYMLFADRTATGLWPSSFQYCPPGYIAPPTFHESVRDAAVAEYGPGTDLRGLPGPSTTLSPNDQQESATGLRVLAVSAIATFAVGLMGLIAIRKRLSRTRQR